MYHLVLVWEEDVHSKLSAINVFKQVPTPNLCHHSRVVEVAELSGVSFRIKDLQLKGDWAKGLTFPIKKRLLNVLGRCDFL